MATKTIYLYDDTNNVLRVRGIQVELYNRQTGTLLDKQFSDDLNPPVAGGSSNEWGVRLAFSIPQNEPVDILFTDSNYEYPGNAIRHLYAGGSDEVNVDLLRIPSGPGGQWEEPPSHAGQLARWIHDAPQWSQIEKEAVENLVFDFVSIFVPRWDSLQELNDLSRTAGNWTEALSKLGIDADKLRGDSNPFRRGPGPIMAR